MSIMKLNELIRLGEAIATLTAELEKHRELVDATEFYILELDGGLISPLLCVNKIESALNRLSPLKEQTDEY